MNTIGQLKKMYHGRYSAIEVYTGDSFHTDSCRSVEEYKDNYIVKKYWLMDEEDYNSTLLANCGVSFSDLYEKNDRVLCLLVTGDREVIAIRNIPYDYDTTDEMTDFHIFVADDMEQSFTRGEVVAVMALVVFTVGERLLVAVGDLAGSAESARGRQVSVEGLLYPIAAEKHHTHAEEDRTG